MKDTNVSVPRVKDARNAAKAGGAAGSAVSKGTPAAAEGAKSAAEAGNAAAGNAANTASNVASGFFNGATGGLKGLSGLLKSAGSAIGKTASGFISAMPGGAAIANIGTAITSFFGSSGAAVAGAAVMAVSVSVTAVAGISAQKTDHTSGVIFDAMMIQEDDCSTGDTISGLASDAEIAETANDPLRQKRAYMMFAAATKWGMTENEAYGMIANAICEGGGWSESVEGHTIGMTTLEQRIAKCQEWTNSDITQSTLPNAYVYAKTGKPGNGVGLLGFTSRGYRVALGKLADAMGKQWYEFDMQLAYIFMSQETIETSIGKDGNPMSTATVFEDYVKDCKSGSDEPAYCVRAFLCDYEKPSGFTSGDSAGRNPQSPDSAYGKRWRKAESDFKTAQTMVAKGKTIATAEDEETIQSILDIVGSMGAIDAVSIAGANACDDGGAGVYDNSSIAAAASSMAWDTEEEAGVSNPTELYGNVHKAIYGGLGDISACDHFMKCSVAWSGSDTSGALVNAGDCNSTIAYFESDEGKSKWEYVGYFGTDVHLADLQPGDVLITGNSDPPAHRHTLVYVGEETIRKDHPNAAPGANAAQASYHDHTGYCITITDSDHNGFRVYRCNNPMNDSKYADKVK